MKRKGMRNAALSFLTAALLSACGGGNGGGCSSNSECAENQFCKFSNNSCGGSGTCADVGGTCGAETAPVCSCEKLTFFSECWADAAGQSVASQGECP